MKYNLVGGPSPLPISQSAKSLSGDVCVCVSNFYRYSLQSTASTHVVLYTVIDNQ